MLTTTKKIITSALLGALFFFFTCPIQAAEVVINEVFSNPVNEADEFVELYNSTDNPIEISGWVVADLVKTYIIPEATISGKSFYVIGQSESKIQLNNSGDETVSLKDKSGQQVDSFSYNGTVEGKSFSRIKDGESSWVAETEPTKNAANQAPPSPSPSPSPTPSPSPSPNPSPSLSPSPKPSSKPSLSPSPSPLEETTATESAATASGEVLGASEPTESAKGKNPFLPALILIGLGIGLLGGAGVVFIRGSKYNKNL